MSLHEFRDLGLLFLVLSQHREVFHLHGLIISHNVFGTLLGLLVLTKAVHQHLVVKLELLDTLSFLLGN